MKYKSLLMLLAVTFFVKVANAEDVITSADPVAVADKPDNGTDPTKFSKTMSAQWEHIELRDASDSDILNLTYWQPLGEKKNHVLRMRVPVSRMNAFGNDQYNLGDASVRWNHVMKITPHYGLISALAMTFDTAQRLDLGAGKNVLMGGLTYAKFLKNGSIFAPAFQHSMSLWGDKLRADVHNTVFDFYYVPKMSNPKWFVTIDPALTLDWENKKEFASMAVTVGRSVGSAFGGNAQLFVKPTAFAGSERPGKWGVEVGYKVVGF